MDVRQVKDFVVESTLGNGGMATVYLAKQGASGRRVALKLMHPHLANDPAFVQRFLQEVKATTGMQHENIVEVVACGEDAGRYFMASEYIDSGTVADLLDQVRKFPAALAADLALQLLEGLGYAHERGVIHRDIKPANLMLTSGGKLKVGDFGIAKTQGSAALTQTGNLIGTPAYMSPEQAQGLPIDQRSDLFSAGVVFYEMLTGFNPYLGENESTTLLKILKSTPQLVFEVDPTVPPALEAVLERLLERDPSRRYPTAKDAIAELAPLVEAERQKLPGAVPAFIRDPQTTKKQLNDQQASMFLWQATERLKQGPAERYQAALDLYRAVLLSPDNTEADALLKQVCAEQKLSFAAPRNPKIFDLEAALESSPDSAGVLMQLASLYRLEGNLYKAVACFKRVLRLRPNDGYVQGQLSILTGEKIRPVTTNKPGLPKIQGATAAAPTGSFSQLPNDMALHTGRTGELRQRPVKPATVAQPVNGINAAPLPSTAVPAELTVEDGSDDPVWMQYAKAIWAAYGKTIIVVLVVGVGGWLVVKKIMKSVDHAISETDRAGEVVAKSFAQQQTPSGGSVESLTHQAQVQTAKFGEEAERALREAKSLEEAGRYDEAHLAGLKVAEDFPKRPQAVAARLVAARALVAGDRAGDAVKELEEFVKANAGREESLEGQVLLGEAYLHLNKMEEANGAATAFLAQHEASPFAGRARLVRAEAELGLGNRDDARKDIEWVRGKYTSSDPLYEKADKLLKTLDPEAPAPAPAPAPSPTP